MRIAGVKINKFRRFADLEIRNIPSTAKLIVLAGPNGTGKSSLFDAFLLLHRIVGGYGWSSDTKYFNRPEDAEQNYGDKIKITLHDAEKLARGGLYVRTAYRHDPDFETKSIARQGDILDSVRVFRLIEADASVAGNYARLASQAMEEVFVTEKASTTIGDFRTKLIGEIQKPLLRLFPDLTFVGVGNPLESGTFQFEKGMVRQFDYKNLSGGEKAAFDLILDLVVKRRSYPNAVYCIDEPETHLNTKVQAALLGEVFDLLPAESQLWVASHSIGVMRKARELYDADPSSVAFLDFGGRDFDQSTVIEPQKPSRAFWEEVLKVALDDLAALIAPREAVICEGDPAKVPGKNIEHDARIYSHIFAEEFPDVVFISAGSANQVTGDFLGLATALPKVAAGMTVKRLIDRDDHTLADILTLQRDGITVLSRRHIEAYLYDDEVLRALCASVGKPEALAAVLAAKQLALGASQARGNPSDDIKSAAGEIYTKAKAILGLTQEGNGALPFARNSLAPLIVPGMAIYAVLKHDIFGL